MNGKNDELCICDACLVQMIEKGESTIGFMGWSLWYERDFPKLIRFTHRRLSKWRLNHLSEDVAQDAFLCGWNNIVSGRFVFTGHSMTSFTACSFQQPGEGDTTITLVRQVRLAALSTTPSLETRCFRSAQT